MRDRNDDWEPVSRIEAGWFVVAMIAGCAPWVALGLFIGWVVWA